jgi:HK97 gp10 family phage protein
VTKVFSSILEFVAELPAIERDLAASGPKIIEKACKIVQARAKKTIGTNQEMWAPLAASTIADKQKHGFKTPAPLLRTGELRDSIEYTVDGLEGEVGSNLDKALFLEMGTSRMPPRSFLRSAAISSEDKIHRMAAAATISALSGYGRNAHDIREMLHMLHRAGHAVKELFDDLLDDDEEGKKR